VNAGAGTTRPPASPAPDRCPRCGGGFACGAAGPAPCACTTVTLSDALQTALRQRYTGCLCLACLQQLAAEEATTVPARTPRRPEAPPRARPLVAHRHGRYSGRMKLLILGGTRFLGRHIAEQALQRGHHVTLLHRGRSGAGLFPQAEHRIADRDGELSVLAQGSWDAAIDTSAYVPRQVHAAAAALGRRVAHYQLVSSISVYADFDTPGTAEDAALQTLPDPTVETVTGDTYGGLKALCEQAAMQAFAGRCLVNRPGLLVGPHDPTGRFSWWVQRLQRGGPVLAPGEPDTPVQFIDARDAAAWMLLQAEQATTGVFNLTGPTQPLTMGRFLTQARDTLNPGAPLHWVAEQHLLDAGVAPWSDLPVWLPRAQAGLHQVDIARALASGLQCRPLAHTLQDTAQWLAMAAPPAAAGTGPARPAVGLPAEREAALLAGWQALQANG